MKKPIIYGLIVCTAFISGIICTYFWLNLNNQHVSILSTPETSTLKKQENTVIASPSNNSAEEGSVDSIEKEVSKKSEPEKLNLKYSTKKSIMTLTPQNYLFLNISNVGYDEEKDHTSFIGDVPINIGDQVNVYINGETLDGEVIAKKPFEHSNTYECQNTLMPALVGIDMDLSHVMHENSLQSGGFSNLNHYTIKAKNLPIVEDRRNNNKNYALVYSKNLTLELNNIMHDNVEIPLNVNNEIESLFKKSFQEKFKKRLQDDSDYYERKRDQSIIDNQFKTIKPQLLSKNRKIPLSENNYLLFTSIHWMHSEGGLDMYIDGTFHINNDKIINHTIFDQGVESTDPLTQDHISLPPNLPIAAYAFNDDPKLFIFYRDGKDNGQIVQFNTDELKYDHEKTLTSISCSGDV